MFVETKIFFQLCYSKLGAVLDASGKFLELHIKEKSGGAEPPTARSDTVVSPDHS